MAGSNIPQRKGPSGPVNPGGSGGGITPPAGQIGGTAVDPLVIGITEDVGAGDELEIGSIAVSQFLRRVGAAIVGVTLAGSMVANDSGVVGASVSDALDTLNAAIGVGVVPSSRTISTTSPLRIDGGASADLSANRTLSVNTVSNTSLGVVPAITAGTAALVSNAGGTAATWVALSGGGSPVGTTRTINTTAPLSGGGDLSADRTLVVAAVSNTSSGVAPITNGTAGQALLSTATGSTWSTNFQAETLTTTGNVILNLAAASIRIGLAPGSGVGSASSTGSIRGALGAAGTAFSIKARNNGDTGDIFVIAWDSANGTIQTGGPNVTNADTISTTNMRFRDTGGTTRHNWTYNGYSGRLTTFQIDSNTGGNSAWSYPGAGNATGFNWTFEGQVGLTTGGGILITGGDASSNGGTNLGGPVTLRGGAPSGAGATHTGGVVSVIGGEPSGASGTRNGGDVVVRPGVGATTDGNVSFMAVAANYQAMERGAFWGNARTNPTGNPANGGFLYATGGAGTWRGSGGTVTTFGGA